MNTGGAHLTYTAFVCANGTHGYEQITLIERTSWLVHDRVYNLLPEFGGAE